jgi:hypothetical protein
MDLICLLARKRVCTETPTEVATVAKEIQCGTNCLQFGTWS